MVIDLELSRFIPEVWHLGLALQVAGTLIAAGALRGEWLDRTPALPESAVSDRENPFKRGSLAANPSVQSSQRGLWVDFTAEGETKRNAEDMKRRLHESDLETRRTLARDWDVQEQTMRDLMERSETFLTSIRDTQQATRRRVVWELSGLCLVTLGTFVSSPLFS